jgi:hypothetical protein
MLLYGSTGERPGQRPRVQTPIPDHMTRRLASRIRRVPIPIHSHLRIYFIRADISQTLKDVPL